MTQGLGHLDQHLVAARMTVGVVELFEMVEIRHDHRQGPVVALGAVDLLLQAFLEMAVVVETGETVGIGQPAGVLEVVDAADPQVEQGHVDRLGHEVGGATAHRVHRDLGAAVARDHEDRQS